MSEKPDNIFAGADWLHAPDLQKVMGALGQNHCRVVGGAVRDSILGRDVKDIDIATDHKPEEASRRITCFSGGKRVSRWPSRGIVASRTLTTPITMVVG